MLFEHDTSGRHASLNIPTAAGLVGAVVFFIVGWVAALQVLHTLPEGTPATYFPLTIALIGLWQGWSVAGRGVHEGRAVAIAYGVRCAIQIAFAGLVLFAVRAVYLRALNMRYDGFDEAFVELARSVYRTNDRRAALKRALNEATGSTLVEEKSYAEY